MTTSNKTVVIGKVKTLIDINGDSVNFEASFSVKSKNKEEFKIAVLNQYNLDNTDVIEYQTISSGEISGKVSNTNNIFNSYYVILTSEKPCVCDVTIVKNVLKVEQQVAVEEQPSSSSNTSYVKYILLVVVVGVILFFVYKKYKAKKSELPVLTSSSPSPPSPSFQMKSPPIITESPLGLTKRLKDLRLN